MLANHAYGEFGYGDLPTVDPDFLAFIEQAIEKSATVFLGSASKAAKSTVITELQRAGIVRTTALETFALTDSGRGSAVIIK